MDVYLKNIWDKSLEFLKLDLNEVSYKTWIQSMTPTKIEDNVIHFDVPNELTKQLLDTRYNLLITNAVNASSQKNYSIEVHISDGEELITSLDDESDNLEIIGSLNDDETTTSLNKKYTFNTFVIGNSNRFAHAACLAVAESPAKSYNPLFIYGGVGLGKTHLMQAIGHYILNNNPKAKVAYVSSEKFTNELVNAIKDDKNEEFRAKYRSVDLILIDDIQFIGGKERTQEEFFHTFNDLYESNKQIILSSDRPPKEIPTLEDRLRSRFEWGLIADIQPPDFETRVAILRKKADVEKLDIPSEVLTYIATSIKSNIRELEGALIRLVAFSSLTGKEISIDLAEEALKDIISDRATKQVTIPLIKDIVASYFNLKVEDLTSSRRTKNIAYPRQIAMYICRKLTDNSLPKIGAEFGGRDHSTVIHSYEKINEALLTDTELKNIIEVLTKKINQK